MTSVSPTAHSGVGTGSLTSALGASGGSGELGRDQFLKLLTTQLQNQDPMSPMQNHEFIAQLAQFSALEQQVETNGSLEVLKLQQQSMSNLQLAGLIGQDVIANADTTQVTSSGASPVGVELAGPAATVDVTVKDSAGNTVATFTRTNVNGGQQSLEWDGRGPNGNMLPPGEYHVSVAAKSSAGNPVKASTTLHGTITGLTFENGYPELFIGGTRIKPADILQFESDGGAASSSSGGGPPSQPFVPSGPAAVTGLTSTP